MTDDPDPELLHVSLHPPLSTSHGSGVGDDEYVISGSARRVILNSKQNCSIVACPAVDTLHSTVRRISLSSMSPQVDRSSTR